MNAIVHHKNIHVAGVTIATDQEGRFCLNDLHKAAGGEDRHVPGYWLENRQAVELVAELETTGIPVVKKVGRNGGTYACRELVYAYAMWISAKFHLQVIHTFDAVATGQLPAPVAAPRQSALAPAKEFRAIFGIARLIGLDKNAAAISANQGTAALTGVNMLQLMERAHLAAPDQEIVYTPTELGRRFVKSAKAFNQLLADAGLQQNVAGHWVPTEKGRPHASVLDTGKAHGSGAPIQQVKWRDSVLGEVAL
jgi:hypothetical protein